MLEKGGELGMDSFYLLMMDDKTTNRRDWSLRRILALLVTRTESRG